MKTIFDKLRSIDLFDIGLFLLMFISMPILISFPFYLIGIPMNILIVPLSFLFAVWYISNLCKDYQYGFIIALLSFALLVIMIIFSTYVFDTSYDGNGYRKIMVGLLKDGWLPLIEDAKTFNSVKLVVPDEISYFGGTSGWVMIDTFGKGTSIVASSIYVLTNNIESGKVYTLVLMVVVFCFSHSYLATCYLKKWQSVIVSFLLACNPVALSQLRTLYADAALNNIVIILLIIILSFLNENYKKETRRTLFHIIFLCILWCISVKLNGMLYAAVFCITFFVVYFIKCHKKCLEYTTAKLFFSLAISVIVSVVVNAQPFITNLLRYKTIIPPSMNKTLGESAFLSLRGLSTPEIFTSVLFGKMGDFWSEPKLPLKVPFTINAGEMDVYWWHAPHFGMFGVLYSGLFIITMVILLSWVLYITKNWKHIEFNAKVMLLFTIIMIVQCIFTPITMGGLRYVGYFYAITPLSIAISFYYLNHKKGKLLFILKPVLFAVICLTFINILPWFDVIQKSFRAGIIDSRTLTTISEQSAHKKVKVAYSNPNFFGLAYNLRDYDIDCELVTKEELEADGKAIGWTIGWQISWQIP